MAFVTDSAIGVNLIITQFIKRHWRSNNYRRLPWARHAVHPTRTRYWLFFLQPFTIAFKMWLRKESLTLYVRALVSKSSIVHLCVNSTVLAKYAGDVLEKNEHLKNIKYNDYLAAPVWHQAARPRAGLLLETSLLRLPSALLPEFEPSIWKDKYMKYTSIPLKFDNVWPAITIHSNRTFTSGKNTAFEERRVQLDASCGH